MSAEREPEWNEDEQGEEAGSDRWSGRALMGRLRLGDPAAFAEYIERYAPIMRETAMRCGGTREFGETIVADVLHDVAVAIRAHRVPRDALLGPYLIGALRRHVLSLREERERHAAAERGLVTALEGEGERAIPDTISAHTLRATRSLDAEVGGADDEMVRRFHDFVRSIVTDEEWMLLGWKSERVFGRDIATWLGRPHSTVRSQLLRLVGRIATASRAYLETLDAAERAYIEHRYLARLRPVRPRKRRTSGG